MAATKIRYIFHIIKASNILNTRPSSSVLRRLGLPASRNICPLHIHSYSTQTKTVPALRARSYVVPSPAVGHTSKTTPAEGPISSKPAKKEWKLWFEKVKGPRPDYRTVFIQNLGPSTTLADVVEGLRESAPVGQIEAVRLIPGPSDAPGIVSASVTYREGKSVDALVEKALASAGLRINGAVAKPMVKIKRKKQGRRENDNSTLSRVVLIFAEVGEGLPTLPSKWRIMRVLAKYAKKRTSSKKKNNMNNYLKEWWDREAVVRYRATGNDGKEVEVMEWRFFTSSQAHACMLALRGKMQAGDKRLAQINYAQGFDPCYVDEAKGILPDRDNRDLAFAIVKLGAGLKAGSLDQHERANSQIRRGEIPHPKEIKHMQRSGNGNQQAENEPEGNR